MRAFVRFVIAFTAVTFVSAAQAIVPGIDTNQWTFAGKIGDLNDFGTSGVAVGDHWILTARHAVGGMPDDGARFMMENGMTFRSIAIYRHATDDIALVRVAETLPGWYDIYWNSDQVGKTTEVVGYGVRGMMVNGDWEFDYSSYGTQRRGANKVTFTQFLDEGGIRGDFIVSDFDGNGIDIFGDGGPVTGESTVGPGDSGGPTFIQENSIWKVAGLHIWIGSAGGPEPPHYGSIYGDIRLSSYRTWYDTIVPAEVLPATMNLLRGLVISGNLQSLYRSDNNSLTLRPGIVFSTNESPIQMVLEGTSPVATTPELRFAVESRANQANLRQTVELFNFNTNMYEVLASANLPTVDTVVEIVVNSSPSRFIDPATRTVRAKLSYRAVGPVFSYPWLISIDRAVWNIAR